MTDTMLKIALASQKLRLLRDVLTDRSARVDTPQAEVNAIALALPLVSEAQRDLDREINALSAAGGAMPLPSPQALEELAEATHDLADAIAGDQKTEVLIGLGDKMLAAARDLSATPAAASGLG
jgi:hypothetical protein